MNTNYFEDIKKVKKQPEDEKLKEELQSSKGAGSKWISIIYVLISVILICLALYVGYYIGKNKGINIGYYQAKSSQAQNTDNSGTVSTKESATSEAASTENASAKTYKVQAGDTLFQIGLKFNIPWTKIAEENGLSENSVIKEGDEIKIPVDAKETNEKTYTINESEYQKYQNNVDDGLEQWRLDPVEVCKRTIPDDFSITKSDIYTLTNQNYDAGQAIVEITHAGQIFKATLTQPVTKGEKGIWAVEKVSNQ